MKLSIDDIITELRFVSAKLCRIGNVVDAALTTEELKDFEEVELAVRLCIKELRKHK